MSRDPEQTLEISPGVSVSVSQVPREDGSDITVYRLAAEEHEGPRSSIVLLHGSGANSVFPKSGNRTSVPLLFGALCEIRDEYDVYFVEKRGIGFGECEPERGAENASIEYRRGGSYQGRVSDVCRVLDELSVDGIHPDCPLVVIGSSEGSNIAVGVAAKHRAPTQIALLPFSAGHGLHLSLIGLRKEFAEGAITASQFQEQYDWLVSTFSEVLGASRDSIDQYLWGHTYRRWSSHCSGTVMADLHVIDIPIFLGIPSLDTCEDIDWVVAEFVRSGKTNLTYRNYINYDHGFFEHTGSRVECRHSEVLTDILEWVRANAESKRSLSEGGETCRP